MDIGFYIADLLRNQDEVSLPGLGTFTKERVAGSYNQTSNSFLPPSYRVSFNNTLSDFNSLSEYISFKKNLSPSSAEYFVKKFASAISDLLQTSGVAEVKPLGTIRQKNENLVFEASGDFEIPGRFYGLKAVADLTQAVAPEVKQTVIPPVIKGGSIEDFITSNSDDEIDDGEPYIEERKSSRALLIILGIFLFSVIAAALLYLFNPAARNLVDRMLPGYVSTIPAVPDSVNVSNASPLVTADSLKAISPAIAQDSTLVDSVENTALLEKEPEPVVETVTIEIVGAAFGKRSEAENYIQTMKKKGLQARILEDMPGPLFKVSLASFPDQQSAQKELNRIKNEVAKDAWSTLYKSKKTQ